MSLKKFNWDEDESLSIDITQLGGNTIATGSGEVTAGTIRVAVASENSSLVSETDQTAGTYHYYIDMSGYNKLSLQLYLPTFTAGSTIKVYGTNQSNEAADSCVYGDITSSVFGINSVISTSFLVDDVGTCGMFRFIRVTVAIGAGGSGIDDYTIWSKKSN
jgi:hypothetical protein